MSNAWVEHVRAFALQNKVAYGCAISIPACRESYHKKKEAKAEHHTALQDLASNESVLSNGRRIAMSEAEFMEQENATYIPPKHARKQSIPKHVSQLPKKVRKPKD